MAQTRGPSAGGERQKLEGGTGSWFFLKGAVASMWQARDRAQNPRRTLERKGDCGAESGTFPGWSQCPWGALEKGLCPSVPHAARSCRGEGPRRSQLAGADGRLQFVGQGGEDLVKLLVAPGLAAAGALAAPEEAHLELRAEHLQELGPGLEP